MQTEDNSVWLQRLINAQRYDPYYKGIQRAFQNDSWFSRIVYGLGTISMLFVLLWAVSTFEFLPGFAHEAQNILSFFKRAYYRIFYELSLAWEYLLNFELF